jgi:predicted dehydrogenase
MNNQPIRLGFVGAGNYTKSRLLPNFKEIPGVELVAVANSTEESSQRVANEFGFGEVMNQWNTLVELPSIDAIVIGTQAPMHAEITLAALSAGKHVFMMNAISATLKEARLMTQKAQEHADLVTMIFPSGRYMREDALMQKLLQDQFVGEIVQVLVHWQTPFFGLGGMYEIARRWVGEHTRILALRSSLDNKIEGPTGRPIQPTTNTLLGQLSNGASIIYIHTPTSRSINRTRIEIHGTAGTLICYNPDEYGDGIYGAKIGEGEPQRLAVPAEMRNEWDNPKGVSVEADFIAAIREGKTPSPVIPTFEDGMRVMEIGEAWGISMKNNTWVNLPLSS